MTWIMLAPDMIFVFVTKFNLLGLNILYNNYKHNTFFIILVH